MKAHNCATGDIFRKIRSTLLILVALKCRLAGNTYYTFDTHGPKVPTGRQCSGSVKWEQM